ncbi:MAG: 50S ribosomal protein L18e [Sulfolobales archaeon]|nr:50S ribosomal protein L18e [Sulfolobales archaeon]MDW8083236.1 50S ribosomal protein L18e [Sulfolobales archaeon]
MRRTGPTNIVLRKLIRELRKSSNQHGVKIWDYVADLLEKPSRRRVVVNLSKLNRCCSQGEYVVVPGKVLGAGNLRKPVFIAAISFSKRALEKIREAGGSAISISDLLRVNPEGSNVRVVM